MYKRYALFILIFSIAMLIVAGGEVRAAEDETAKPEETQPDDQDYAPPQLSGSLDQQMMKTICRALMIATGCD